MYANFQNKKNFNSRSNFVICLIKNIYNIRTQLIGACYLWAQIHTTIYADMLHICKYVNANNPISYPSTMSEFACLLSFLSLILYYYLQPGHLVQRTSAKFHGNKKKKNITA